MEVSSDNDNHANPPKKRKITAVLEETVCNKNVMNRDQGYNTRSGTTLDRRESTEPSALPCVMSVVACEQPAQQTVTDPFIEQSSSSSSTIPSGE